jgi:hypothetical protein
MVDQTAATMRIQRLPFHSSSNGAIPPAKALGTCTAITAMIAEAKYSFYSAHI